MYQTAMGVSLPDASRIREEYEREGDNLTMLLSFEKLAAFVQEFVKELPAPLFLAIHPDAEKDEVYYLDQIPHDYMDMILDGYGELLYQDGLSAFAIGSLQNNAELYVQKYKVISLYAPNLSELLPMVERYGVKPTDHLVTPWDTFSEEAPGSVTKLEIAGQTIDDMIEALQQIGMYRG